MAEDIKIRFESLIYLIENAINESIKKGSDFERNVSQAEACAESADDYRQIMNAMGKHAFGYYGQIQSQELEKYWSKRDDIVYAHGNMAYYGKQNVYNYYTGMTEALKKKGREIAKNIYGKEVSEDEGPGYKVMNMLLSPYVEIAADRKTARGIWMAYSYMTHLKDDGTPDTSIGLSRFAGEFIREDDEWKLWHRVDYIECGLEYLGIGSMGGPPPDKPKNGSGKPTNGSPMMPTISYKNQKTLKQRSGGGGAPFETAFPEPAIPEPYETWKEELSYIIIDHDGYTAGH